MSGRGGGCSSDGVVEVAHSRVGACGMRRRDNMATGRATSGLGVN
jgi:hypothetical protein